MQDVTFKFLDGTVVVPFSVEVQPGKFLTGTVRPPVPKELTAHFREVAKADDPDAVRAKFYAAHVKSWNVERPPTAETIAALPPVLFGALAGVVLDQAGCDLVLKKSDASSPS